MYKMKITKMFPQILSKPSALIGATPARDWLTTFEEGQAFFKPVPKTLQYATPFIPGLKGIESCSEKSPCESSLHLSLSASPVGKDDLFPCETDLILFSELQSHTDNSKAPRIR